MLKSKKFVAVLVTLFALAALAAARTPDGTFEKTYTINGRADLEVLTRSGDIIFHPGPAGTISVRGKIYVGDRWFSGSKTETVKQIENNPPIKQSGNSVHIDYVNIRNIAIDYEITAPADSQLRTQTGSGDQTVEGLNSTVNLESGSGDMRLRSISGDLRVHTGSGDIEARDITATFSAEAGSGDVRLEAQHSSDVRVHTGSGNIDVSGVRGGLNLEAGSGDIRIDGEQTSGWEVRTGSGNVQMNLPASAGFDLDASTGSGRLVVNHPVTMTVQGNVQGEHHSVNGKVHGGGPVLMVRTGSGDVDIN